METRREWRQDLGEKLRERYQKDLKDLMDDEEKDIDVLLHDVPFNEVLLHDV